LPGASDTRIKKAIHCQADPAATPITESCLTDDAKEIEKNMPGTVKTKEEVITMPGRVMQAVER
jgi:hypothetical protein